MEKFIRFLKLREQTLEPIRVVGRGHLAEIIGGGQRVANHAADWFAEMNVIQLLRWSGATYRPQHHVGFEIVCAERRQIGRRKRTAPQHVVKGVLGPRADLVGP